MSVPNWSDFMLEHTSWDLDTCVIAFAKSHCVAQREAILEQAEAQLEYEGHDEDNDQPMYSAQIVKATIINAYPLSNIV